MLLAIWTGVNEPQLPAGAQVNVTPALFVSLATTAVISAKAPVSSEAGGCEKNVTTIAGGWYLGSPQAASVAMPAIATTILAIGRIDGRRVMT